MTEFESLFASTPEGRLHTILFDHENGKDLFRELGSGEFATKREVEVDVGVARLAVNNEQARIIKEELLAIVEQFPGLSPSQLSAFGRGLSYIEAGATVGSQRTALVLFGIGEALGWWQVVTPKKMFGEQFDDELNSQMMGLGYITIERRTA